MIKKTNKKNFEKVNQIILANSKPLNPEAIRNGIRRLAKSDKFEEYAGMVLRYISTAIMNNDPEIRKIFRKVFFQELETYGLFFIITIYAMSLEGLKDLVRINSITKKILETDDYLKPKIDDFAPPPTHHPPFKKLREIYYHSKFNNPLLIVGETGTSKRLLAKTIHTISGRWNQPFIDLNCAAIPESILESELFGVIPEYPGLYNKQGKIGKIELAKRGFLFLDELGKMPTRLQTKILKVIEEKKIARLGSETPVDVDVRFIAAAQPSSIKNILPGLKYSLGYPDIIQMSTLNQRLDEAGEFILNSIFSEVMKKMEMKEENLSLSSECREILMQHKYKGNYRELENILRRTIMSALVNERDKIIPEDILSINETAHRLIQSETKDAFKKTVALKRIRIIDIIEYADKAKVSLVEKKIVEFLRTGKDLKSIFKAEGLSDNDYQNFRKKIENITGKGIREFKKQLCLSE